MGSGLILLADDEPHITHVVERKLRSAGFEVEVARDGEEALRLAVDLGPKLVVTDLQMPHMSGIELAEALSADERTAKTPVILLTARGYFLSQQEIERTNIKRVVGKPFTARGLLETVVELLGGAAETARSAA